MNENMRVMVKVGLFKEGRILLGHKVNTSGLWTLPEGEQSEDEEINQCIKRIILENTKLYIDNIEIFDIDSYIESNQQFITLFIEAKQYSNTLDLVKLDEIDRWRWFKLNELPKPVYSLIGTEPGEKTYVKKRGIL